MLSHILNVPPGRGAQVGHFFLLVGQGGPTGRAVSSPMNGHGAEKMESSKVMKPKSKKMTKTNIVPPTWRARCRVSELGHRGIRTPLLEKRFLTTEYVVVKS
jgi:hypothetical protein